MFLERLRGFRRHSRPHGEPSHKAICDGCECFVIHGTRHRCLVCDDFDFCSDCIGAPGKRLLHDISHPFFPITRPDQRQEFEQIRMNMSYPPSGTGESRRDMAIPIPISATQPDDLTHWLTASSVLPSSDQCLQNMERVVEKSKSIAL